MRTPAAELTKPFKLQLKIVAGDKTLSIDLPEWYRTIEDAITAGNILIEENKTPPIAEVGVSWGGTTLVHRTPNESKWQ